MGGGSLHLGHLIGALAWEPGRLARCTETNVQVFVCCVALPPRVLANSSTYWMSYRLEPLHVDMCMYVCVCKFVSALSTQLIYARALLSSMNKSALSPLTEVIIKSIFLPETNH